MKPTMIGIGGLEVSTKPGSVIKTMALGSCIGVAILTRYPQTVSMIHIALPSSKAAQEKAKLLPGYFADTGLPLLFKKLEAAGYNKLKSQIVVKIVGGANVLDNNSIFNVGKRNILAVQKLLFMNKIRITKEDVGKNISRTLWIEFDTGKVFASNPTLGTWEI